MSAKPKVSNLPKGTPNLPSRPIAPATDAPMPTGPTARLATLPPACLTRCRPHPATNLPGRHLAGVKRVVGRHRGWTAAGRNSPSPLGSPRCRALKRERCSLPLRFSRFRDSRSTGERQSSRLGRAG